MRGVVTSGLRRDARGWSCNNSSEGEWCEEG